MSKKAKIVISQTRIGFWRCWQWQLMNPKGHDCAEASGFDNLERAKEAANEAKRLMSEAEIEVQND